MVDIATIVTSELLANEEYKTIIEQSILKAFERKIQSTSYLTKLSLAIWHGEIMLWIDHKKEAWK